MISTKKRQRFFILLGMVYDLMPGVFHEHVKRANFYKYIQRQRKAAGYLNTSTKGMDNEQFNKMMLQVLSYLYANIFVLYYDVYEVISIQKRIKKEFKTLFE